jgi:hypothetical protein
MRGGSSKRLGFFSVWVIGGLFKGTLVRFGGPTKQRKSPVTQAPNPHPKPNQTPRKKSLKLAVDI